MMNELNTSTTGAVNGENNTASEDVNIELGEDSHKDHNLVLTPSTEVSTPESDDCQERTVGEEDGMNPNTKSAREEASESSTYEEQNLYLQRHMSQTDNHIRLLDRSGDLNEVAGSQSMLSQELIYHRHDSDDDSGDEEATNTSTAACLLEDLGLEKGSKPETSIGIAKRLGLLSQAEDEDAKYPKDEAKLETNAEHGIVWSRFKVSNTTTKDNKLEPDRDASSSTTSPQTETDGKVNHLQLHKEQPAAASNHSSPVHKSFDKSAHETSLSGLELLTQVGIKEANKVEAMKSKSASVEGELVSNQAIAVAAMISIPKAPVRDNEGFGSLLDAVAKLTEQEASEADCSMDWVSPSTTAETCTTKRHGKKRKNTLSTNKSENLSTKVQRKSETQKLKEKIRREKIEQENERAQAVAKRAAIIAERTITDPIIAKKLLLSMALARENPRTVPQDLPGKGHVVQKSFFWAHYPPLELVLKKHMAEYYELSTHQCQSRQQQAFNNYMVGLVKDVAERQEWKFADSFCDKSLRDRIRCYYKTHIQNAKKRLRTMVRNPTKKANARHLCEHLDLIEKHRVEEEREKKAKTVQPNAKKSKD